MDDAARTDWNRRIDSAWATFASDEQFDIVAAVHQLTDELPDGDPQRPFQRAGAQDSTGHPDAAIPLYRSALFLGLDDPILRQATMQLASSLRRVGRVDEAVAMLEAERARTSDDLDDAVAVFLALALADMGHPREALACVVEAIAPHLTRYQRSARVYARALLDAR